MARFEYNQNTLTLYAGRPTLGAEIKHSLTCTTAELKKNLPKKVLQKIFEM